MTETSQQQPNEALATASKLIGGLANHMGGYITLIAAVLVWIAWFLLPAISMNTFFAEDSFTFWRLLSIDFSNTVSMNPNTSVGLAGFVGFLAIIAPFVAPFLKAPWAKYLFAAPLAFVVLYGFRLWVSISSIAGGAQNVTAQVIPGMGRMVTSAYAFGIGAYVLLIGSFILALRVIKTSPATQAH
jgi:hypothetical protein